MKRSNLSVLCLSVGAAFSAWAETPPVVAVPPASGLDTCPAAVRAAVLKAAGTDPVKRVRTVRRGEQTLYLADIDREGDHDLKLQLVRTGEIIRRTEELPLSALPAPVSQALAALAGTSGRIEETKKITEDGAPYFKAEIDLPDGTELDVKLAEDGAVLEKKEDTEG